jgi:hypothetical protein
MNSEAITDYYSSLAWGNHINLFSVLCYLRDGQTISSSLLHSKVFFRGSQIMEGQVHNDVTIAAKKLRHRQIMYYIRQACHAGYMDSHRPVSPGWPVFVINEKGRQFVAKGIEDRIAYLRRTNVHISIACTNIEAERHNPNKAPIKTNVIKRETETLQTIAIRQSADSSSLEFIWGIRHPEKELGIRSYVKQHFTEAAFA